MASGQFVIVVTVLFYLKIVLRSLNCILCDECICLVCLLVALGGKKRTFDSTGTGVTEGCELSCGRWKSNTGSLQEKQGTCCAI